MKAVRRWQDYYTPSTVAEALDVLQRYDGQARVVGGGTDLLVETRRGLHRPVDALVDVTRIGGLGEIAEQDGYIVIGCGVTHTTIINDPLIIRHGTCLAESCGVIGGPQVRNVGTLAGNVAHALPAGDGTIGLLALGGEIEVNDQEGSRWIPLQVSFKAPGKSFINRFTQILTRLRFRPTTPGEGSAHHRVMRPQGLCLPIISMGARLRIENGTITDARISMGPVGPVPYLAEPAMAAIQDEPATQATFEKAADVALQCVQLRESKYRASRRYREQMIRTWLPIILDRASQRAQAGAA